MAKNQDDMLSKIDSKLDEVSECLHRVDKEVALQKSAFDDHLKQDEKMYEEFKRMNDILQSNTESLKEHMHRTALLEQLAQKMDARLTTIELEKLELAAIKKYRNEKLMKIAKILGIIATIVAIIAGIKGL
jgi:Mg2+ and Co2+ transporter CorA